MDYSLPSKQGVGGPFTAPDGKSRPADTALFMMFLHSVKIMLPYRKKFKGYLEQHKELTIDLLWYCPVITFNCFF